VKLPEAKAVKSSQVKLPDLQVGQRFGIKAKYPRYPVHQTLALCSPAEYHG
jgi:hypothetical protein